MHHIQRTVIERELELQLVLSPERSVPVSARFTYRTCDPLAVHCTFHLSSPDPVEWTFARELLIEGIFRPSGHGDVRVWPDRFEGRGVVSLALCSPDGVALLHASASAVSAWLERTLRAVPPGSEHEALGLDEGLRELLHATLEDGVPPSGDPGPQEGSGGAEAGA